MKLRSGLKLLDEKPGAGRRANKGDLVSFEFSAILARGDPVHERVCLEHRLGSREIIAGIEYALEGMREGGYRRVRVSPHLGYGETEVPGRIPPNAVLICDIWLHGVRDAEAPSS
jgi:FKBP-type peptidyl-prolyl cis-trans isomerase